MLPMMRDAANPTRLDPQCVRCEDSGCITTAAGLIACPYCERETNKRKPDVAVAKAAD
jgi:hypothetical protein